MLGDGPVSRVPLPVSRASVRNAANASAAYFAFSAS